MLQVQVRVGWISVPWQSVKTPDTYQYCTHKIILETSTCPASSKNDLHKFVCWEQVPPEIKSMVPNKSKKELLDGNGDLFTKHAMACWLAAPVMVFVTHRSPSNLRVRPGAELKHDHSCGSGLERSSFKSVHR